jgi:hypothetical protein
MNIGTIFCRLPAGSPGLINLLKKLQDRSTATCTFLVEESINGGCSRPIAVGDITPNLPFAVPVKFRVHAEGNPIRIYLSWNEDPEKNSLISGFPRCIVSKSSPNSCRSSTHIASPIRSGNTFYNG